MNNAVLYLHGFRSSPESWKARLLSEALIQRGQGERLYCPALSHIPEQAIHQAEAIVASHPGRLTVVGSSLGGFYATWLAERYDLQAALINPAVTAPLALEDYLGPQTMLHSGEAFELTTEHIAQLRALELRDITPERYLLMVETGDEVLDYRRAVERYAGSRQIVLEGGNHSFSRFPDYLPQLIEYCWL